MNPIDIPEMLKLAKEVRIKADKAPSGTTWYWSAHIAELTDAVETLAAECEKLRASAPSDETKT